MAITDHSGAYVPCSTAGPVEIPRIVSMDDHVVEPAHLWSRWLPARYRNRGPRVVRRRLGPTPLTAARPSDINWDEENGTEADVWVFEDYAHVHRHVLALLDSDGEGPDASKRRTDAAVTYDQMRPGCYDPAARLMDMDMAHVEASLCFPTFARFSGQLFTKRTDDRELGLACIRAYNDWMVEEWCGDSGGRLLPLCIIPLWDAELAAAEVRRNADRGVRAVAFTEIPAYLGLPSIHSGFWEPFFAACAETGTVVAMHVGSATRMQSPSADAPYYVVTSLNALNSMVSLTDFLFSGVLERHPKLKLCYGESQIGWIPFQLERADAAWEEHRGFAGTAATPHPPSTYFHRQVLACFFADTHGLRLLDTLGADNVAFETDYPHSDGSWPVSREHAAAQLAGLPAEVIHRVVRGNAIKALGLPLT